MKDRVQAFIEFIRPYCHVQDAGHGEFIIDGVINVEKAIDAAIGEKQTPPTGSHVSVPDTATVARHMKDFETAVARMAPKLHWKVWQDLGADPSRYNGGYDGWQHGFGQALFGPMPLPQLIEEMKASLSAKVALAHAGQPVAAWRYRFEPDLQWHVAEFVDQLPRKEGWPLLEVQPLYAHPPAKLRLSRVGFQHLSLPLLRRGGMAVTEVTVTVSGPVGCGKPAIAGEIEIALKAIGIPVRFADEKEIRSEKNMTGADWTGYIEMYKPSVVIVEQSLPPQTREVGPENS